MDAQKVYSDFLLILAAHHQYLSSHKATDMAAWHMKVDAAAQDLGAILALRLNPEQAASWQRIDEKLRDYEQHPTANQILALTQKVTTLADDRVAAELQATRIVTSNLGKKLMDSMRDLDAQGIEREQAKSHMEEAKNQHLVLQAEIAGFGGPIITALLTLTIIVLFLRKKISAVQRIADAASDIAKGNLRRRTNEHIGGELGRLTKAFDHMAAQLEERHRQTELLARLSETLQISRNLKEAYDATGNFCGELFSATQGEFYLINASRNIIESVIRWGFTEPQGSNSVYSPQDCRALRAGHPYQYTAGRSELPCAHLSHPLPGYSLCVPLVSQDETLGILHIQASQCGDDEAVRSRRELSINIAEQLALAISNLRLREMLRHESIRDPLTNLFNRRYLEETLEREIRRMERKQQSLALIIFDLDHFKRYNDTCSHDAGDMVLVAFSTELKQAVRAEDIACRYGGDEFVLILLDASLEVAQARAEEVRVATEALQITYQKQSLGKVTVSAGVAMFPVNGVNPEVLLHAADTALYRAKHSGRNCIVIIDEKV